MNLSREKPKLIVVLGPTASGKTEMALEIACRTGACIVSADSIQVYRHFDIGSAKPTEEQRRELPHFLIDIVDPDEDFNAGTYMRLALDCIKGLVEDGKKVVVVGGTFLYVKALLYGLLEGVEIDREFRDRLARERDARGVVSLHKRLESIDPVSAGRINPNDYVRIERALEVYHATGQKISDHQRRHGFSEQRFNAFKIGFLWDRERLRRAIDARVDAMIDRGWVEEVKAIRAMGYGPHLKPMKSIGYKRINEFLDGRLDFETAVESIKTDTKRFSKRQSTWLRADDGIKWLDPADEEGLILEACSNFLG
ncbi:MAG: tRNA (adenosine(37)-N6)-dimethylallyltransferase MiaA [Candidatus Dadabacteria bacterium]|nr:tRNA (adenosine(37)-N6)-dimethylallyltransferase MiaA [Candidatus Dadabacteria bacterium]MYA48257.1 tRNA (adenosine(37)-N6)-dimethylallyltransferase MiaA [Candidatus Dadabacteria bacterium]MYF47742.1 tRNA (adenosine(37)-N6)-dimethylallyltransferase MiaA [Candidatus Dadabacteria bacterium]MYK49834.1 tRNA (adenosine(37)-N6)-dimethylallyltransferase MiaA [Candidatus Dadabacteria bacterium]